MLKTHIIHQGGVQRITGLVVNGDSVPPVPRNIKRMLRAAIHNLEQGKPFKEGRVLIRYKVMLLG